MKIGFQGINGAYSESALFSHFGKEVEAVGFDTSEEVFTSFSSKKIDFAVLPFENTIAGSVAVNYDLMAKENATIIAEVFLPIRHYLISHKGNNLKNIKTVYSHPHALEQCRVFTSKHILKPIPVFDTAGGAKIVKDNMRIDEAAIASELCAKIYDMDILAEDLQSSKNNITKFFVVARPSDVPKNIKMEKTSIALKTKHYPGALVNCLQRLAKNNINLTKLESRPVPENPWEYVFFIDFEGGVNQDNVKLSLVEMEAAALFIKVLGSYPKGKA
jgi:prephenate dehydratase